MKDVGKISMPERTQIYDDNRKDPYLAEEKHPESTICNSCGALFTNGRWTWDDIPSQVSHAVCPACQRIEDQYPAGIIKLKGPFLGEHYSQIINLIKNTQRRETSDHPLERIIDIKDEKDTTIITTTGIHLARQIGDALFRAYKGNLSYNYDDKKLIRVRWSR